MKNILYISLILLTIIACEKEETTTSDFSITSIAISDGELLDDYKCEEKTGEIEKSIPLAWENVPENTNSLAIIMHHNPNENETNHYLLLWDIDPSVTEIAHGMADDGAWYIGSNKDETAISYTSPCSQGAGTHEYTITIYALSETPTSLPIQNDISVTYDVLKDAISTVSILGEATIVFNDVN